MLPEKINKVQHCPRNLKRTVSGSHPQLLLAEIRSPLDSENPQDQRSKDSKEQLLMLERLTVKERIELRRLVAKAQGNSEPDPIDAESEAVEQVRAPERKSLSEAAG